MLHLSTACRYFYYNGIVDMRKGAYSLSGLIRNEMNQDVLSGDVFIFIGKRANKIKLLQWDSDGLALYEKGLERGSFERPAGNSNNNAHFSISAQQLQYILQGVVLKSIRHRKRFSLTSTTV
jgi:transposase